MPTGSLRRSPQHASLLSPPRKYGSTLAVTTAVRPIAQSAKKESYDIEAILATGSSPGLFAAAAEASPSHFLSGETSTQEMESDLSRVAMTPFKVPAAARPARLALAATSRAEDAEQEKARRAMEDEMRAASEALQVEQARSVVLEEARVRAEAERQAVEAQLSAQARETEALRRLLASCADGAARLATLERSAEVSNSHTADLARAGQKLARAREANALLLRGEAVRSAREAWTGLVGMLEAEESTLAGQRETMLVLGQMLTQLRGAALARIGSGIEQLGCV